MTARAGPTSGAPRLSDAQRSSVGGLLATLEELLARLRALGVESPALDELDRAVSRIAEEAAAIRPRRGREAQGLVSQAFVLAAELDARSLRSYGDVTPELAAWADARGRELRALARRLLDEV